MTILIWLLCIWSFFQFYHELKRYLLLCTPYHVQTHIFSPHHIFQTKNIITHIYFFIHTFGPFTVNNLPIRNLFLLQCFSSFRPQFLCLSPCVPQKAKQYYEFGESEELHCFTGFELEGFQYINCLPDGTWSPPQIKCNSTFLSSLFL